MKSNFILPLKKEEDFLISFFTKIIIFVRFFPKIDQKIPISVEKDQLWILIFLCEFYDISYVIIKSIRTWEGTKRTMYKVRVKLCSVKDDYKIIGEFPFGKFNLVMLTFFQKLENKDIFTDTFWMVCSFCLSLCCKLAIVAWAALTGVLNSEVRL